MANFIFHSNILKINMSTPVLYVVEYIMHFNLLCCKFYQAVQALIFTSSGFAAFTLDI